jgi:hypothetical protein
MLTGRKLPISASLCFGSNGSKADKAPFLNLKNVHSATRRHQHFVPTTFASGEHYLEGVDVMR